LCWRRANWRKLSGWMTGFWLGIVRLPRLVGSKSGAEQIFCKLGQKTRAVFRSCELGNVFVRTYVR
jgi:hypothetical protein